MRSNNQRVIHKTNELVTVVNHTFAELRLNREHIRDIEAYISKLHDRIARWTATSTISFERVRANLRIDQCLSALESVHLYWVRQLSRYQRQRAALESGILTVDILPPTSLRFILATSRWDGRTAPRLEWYYQFVRVKYMWEDEQHLVLTADVPLTDHAKYMRYHMRGPLHIMLPAMLSKFRYIQTLHMIPSVGLCFTA